MFAQVAPQLPQISENVMIWMIGFGMLFSLIFWGLIIWGAVKLFSGRGKTSELEKEVAYLKGRLDKIDPKPPAAP